MLNSLVIPPCCSWGNPDVSWPLVFLSEYPLPPVPHTNALVSYGAHAEGVTGRPNRLHASLSAAPKFQEHFPKGILREISILPRPAFLFPSTSQSWAPNLLLFLSLPPPPTPNLKKFSHILKSAIRRTSIQAILRPSEQKGRLSLAYWPPSLLEGLGWSSSASTAHMLAWVFCYLVCGMKYG